jgi:hypothetical protein
MPGWASCLFAMSIAIGASAAAEDLAAAEDAEQPKLKEPTAAQKKIASAIAGGHAYQKHVVDEELFPEVKNKEEFGGLIARVIANPSHHRKLENQREAFYDKKSNTIVIYNPRARDKGTCFKPRGKLNYFNNLE